MGFQNFAWGFNSQKNKILGKKIIRGTPLPLIFKGFFGKKLKVPRIA
jgi:hypothetical protein